MITKPPKMDIFYLTKTQNGCWDYQTDKATVLWRTLALPLYSIELMGFFLCCNVLLHVVSNGVSAANATSAALERLSTDWMKLVATNIGHHREDIAINWMFVSNPAKKNPSVDSVLTIVKDSYFYGFDQDIV